MSTQNVLGFSTVPFHQPLRPFVWTYPTLGRGDGHLFCRRRGQTQKWLHVDGLDVLATEPPRKQLGNLE